LYICYQIPPFYDSLLGKIIAWGSTREEAIARMRRALSELRVEGVKTTTGFHEKLLANDEFRRGRTYTTFVEEVLQERR
jgi:acetyl-CoA carboxylase biotin carboxylase subunit